MQREKIPRNEGFSEKVGTRAANSSQSKTQSELKRLQEITKDSIPDAMRKVAMPLLHNLAWQKVKLDEARIDLMGESIYVPYDNGGGQTGIREHPGFQAYNRLFTTFQRGIKQLCEMMDAYQGEADELQSYFDETRIE